MEGAVEREPRSERAEEAVGFEDYDLRMLLAQRAQQQGAGEREYLPARAAYVGGDALLAPKLQGRDGAKRLGVSQNEDVDAIARLAEHAVGLGIALTEFGLVVFRLHDARHRGKEAAEHDAGNDEAQRDAHVPCRPLLGAPRGGRRCVMKHGTSYQPLSCPAGPVARRY